MKVIISGSMDLQDPSQAKDMLQSAKPYIEGALAEDGCIAYDWTESHLVPGRIHVYEEWESSETLDAHLSSHWYRDMGAHLATYRRKPRDTVIKKYRVDFEEPVYDATGVARGQFFTLPD